MSSTSGISAWLRAAVDVDVFQAVSTATILGLVFHNTFLRVVEVEGFMYTLIALGFITFSGLVAVHIYAGFVPLDAFARVSLLSISFNFAVFLSIGLYRVFFHRLRKFPGPSLAKVSRFYSAYKASQDLKYCEHVREWKQEYGDFIRTGPRELAIIRKSAVPLIYGPESKCRKSTWYGQVDTDPAKCSIHMTRDHEQHKRRRRVWDRGFAIKALNTYEPLINSKVDEFIEQLSNRGTVDATAWSMLLAFDIMGKVGFGKEFYGVSKGQEHPAIEGVHSSMNILGVMSHIPWLLNMMGKIPGAAAAYQEFFAWCGSEIEAKKKNWNAEEYPQDVISWLVKAVMEKDPAASPSDPALHEDSRVMIVAGSETTATTLACIFYYLAKHPAVQEKLQARVDAALGRRWSYEEAKNVTYIDDIINETLRLKPALLTGGFRVTPPQGITVDGTFIPGDTNVFVPVQTIQTDPRYWAEAGAFVPERFGERRAELGTDGAPFLPFTLGAYQCPGKNLAFLSLRIAVSRVVREFDVAFAPGETGEVFDRNAKDTFTTTLPPVMITFTKRK
ncbi:hypothetical protein diail_5472 [Diaporthe ilicicola]|nr:hypothetical protein diail_5472 [Diaporthe ilicicola]